MITRVYIILTENDSWIIFHLSHPYLETSLGNQITIFNQNCVWHMIIDILKHPNLKKMWYCFYSPDSPLKDIITSKLSASLKGCCIMRNSFRNNFPLCLKIARFSEFSPYSLILQHWFAMVPKIHMKTNFTWFITIVDMELRLQRMSSFITDLMWCTLSHFNALWLV